MSVNGDRPEAGIFGEAIYAELESMAWDDKNQAWSLLKYLDAIGQMFDEIEELARDSDEEIGWCTLLNPDKTPAKALPWLAQFVGATLAPTLTEAEQRAYIKEAANWKRGSVGAIIGTTQFFLTGSKTVRIDERDSSPYHYTITVSPDEVGDLALVTAALDKQKPAGLQYQLILTTTRTYFQVRTDKPTYNNVKADYANYQAMRGG